MKYKVGDKVRIKSIDWYNKNMDDSGKIQCGGSSFYVCMKNYCGEMATIMKVRSCFYKLDIDDFCWFWTDEMFDETYNENKMESKKVKITLPKNCEVEKVETSVEDGYLVVEYTPKEKFSPKDGDILSDGELIVLYKGTHEYGGIYCYCYLYKDEKFDILKGDGRGCGFTKEYREATKEEKESLLNRLKEKGYTFNQETKKIEKIRWRAKDGEYYYYVNSMGQIDEDTERYWDEDTGRFEIGNYFKTKEEAQKYADKIKELLKDRL